MRNWLVTTVERTPYQPSRTSNRSRRFSAFAGSSHLSRSPDGPVGLHPPFQGARLRLSHLEYRKILTLIAALQSSYLSESHHAQ